MRLNSFLLLYCTQLGISLEAPVFDQVFFLSLGQTLITGGCTNDMVCIFQKKLVARGMSIPDSRVESIIFAILVDLRYNVLWNYFESLARSLSVDEYMLLYQQTHILQSDKNKSVKRKSVHNSLKHQINVQRNVLWATLTKLFKK